MHAWAWTGGGFEPADGIPVTDRAFRYGMSVFESLRIHNGTPILLDNHLRVLQWACDAVEFIPPAGAFAACGELFKNAPDGFARIYVTAGDGSVNAPLDRCRVLIFIEPREPVAPNVYLRGYDLAIHPQPWTPPFPGLKTGNYWPHVRAFNAGIANQCNESLLLSPDGVLISAAMANVFIVTNGKLMTPASYLGSTGPSDTCRPGTVREWVMRNFRIAQESFIRRDQLDAATEIFLTSSWLGIMPVASIEGRQLLRSVTTTVFEAYRQEFGLP
jgi:branched-subunit amino acid aminotransferase/4-amino-4-deoxychorismate lyase